MMRKLFVQFETGYCGEEGAEILEFSTEDSDSLIDKEVWYLAIQHAEMYGHEDEEDMQNVEGWWEDYIPEKHDDYI